jgi:hypothetical protein
LARAPSPRRLSSAVLLGGADHLHFVERALREFEELGLILTSRGGGCSCKCWLRGGAGFRKRGGLIFRRRR